jgi:hypothetical protein
MHPVNGFKKKTAVAVIDGLLRGNYFMEKTLGS